MIAMVLAMDVHGLIGKNNDLPWHFPEDLKYFKSLTLNHTVLMGRKTFESIINRLGKPLPNRDNVVLTSKDIQYPNVQVIRDLDAYLKKNQSKDIYIIGGKQVFESAMDDIDTLYVTHIKHLYEGDTFIDIDFSNFTLAIIRETDDLIFTRYERIQK